MEKICVPRVYYLFSWAGKRSADLHHLDETKVAHLRLEPECARGETSVPATDRITLASSELNPAARSKPKEGDSRTTTLTVTMVLQRYERLTLSYSIFSMQPLHSEIDFLI